MSKARHFLKFKTSEVPGDVSQRQYLLREHFYQHINRQLTDQDYVHVPALIDSPDNKSAWIVFDINVGDKGQNLANIPIQCWRVKYNDGNPQFIMCMARVQGYNHILRWGGTNNFEYRGSALIKDAIMTDRC